MPYGTEDSIFHTGDRTWYTVTLEYIRQVKYKEEIIECQTSSQEASGFVYEHWTFFAARNYLSRFIKEYYLPLRTHRRQTDCD